MSECSYCDNEKKLNRLIKHVQEKELTLKQLNEQMAQQQELLNEVLWEIRKGRLPSRPSSSAKSPFSILENLELDKEKLTKIAFFIMSLYNNSNEGNE
jgi:hypothetical protein